MNVYVLFLLVILALFGFLDYKKLKAERRTKQTIAYVITFTIGAVYACLYAINMNLPTLYETLKPAFQPVSMWLFQ